MRAVATIVGMLLGNVVASCAAQVYAEPVQSASSLIVAVHEGIGLAMLLKTAEGHSVRSRETAIANDDFDQFIQRRTNDELLTGLENVRSALRPAAVQNNAQGRLAADVRRDELQSPVDRCTNTGREERALPSMLPLLLDHSGVGDERGCEREQGGNDGHVVHGDDERSRLFDGRTSKGERLAIILIAAILVGTGLGVAAATMRLAETCIGRLIAGAAAVLFLVMIGLLTQYVY